MGIITTSSSVGSWANKNNKDNKVHIPGQGYSYTSGGIGYEVSPTGTTKIIAPTTSHSHSTNKTQTVDTTLPTSGMTTPTTQSLTQQQLLTVRSSGGVSLGGHTYVGNAIVPGTGGLTANNLQSNARKEAIKLHGSNIRGFTASYNLDTNPYNVQQKLSAEEKVKSGLNSALNIYGNKVGEAVKVLPGALVNAYGETTNKIFGFITPNLKGDYSRYSSEEKYRRSQINLSNSKPTTIYYSQTPVSQEFLESNKFFEVSAENKIQQKELSLGLSTDLTSQVEVDKANKELQDFSDITQRESNFKASKRDFLGQVASTAVPAFAIGAISTLSPGAGIGLGAIGLTSAGISLSNKETREWIGKNPEAFATTTGASLLGGAIGGFGGAYTVGKIKTGIETAQFRSSLNKKDVGIFGVEYKDITGKTNIKELIGQTQFKDNSILFRTKSYNQGGITVGDTSILKLNKEGTEFIQNPKSKVTFISKGASAGNAFEVIRDTGTINQISKEFGTGYLSRTLTNKGGDINQGFAGIKIGKFTFFKGGSFLVKEVPTAPTSFIGYEAGAGTYSNVKGIIMDYGNTNINLNRNIFSNFIPSSNTVRANLPAVTTQETLTGLNMGGVNINSVVQSFSKLSSSNVVATSLATSTKTSFVTASQVNVNKYPISTQGLNFQALNNKESNIFGVQSEAGLKNEGLLSINTLSNVDTVNKHRGRFRTPVIGTQIRISEKVDIMTPIPNVTFPTSRSRGMYSLQQKTFQTNGFSFTGTPGGFTFPFKLNLGSPYSRRLAPSRGRKTGRTIYSPSYGSAVLGFTAPRGFNTKQVFSGLELRPLVFSNLYKRKKSNKRRK